MTVFVLVKAYSDHSAWYVVRVYTDRERAEADLALVKDDSVFQWTVHEVPLFT